MTGWMVVRENVEGDKEYDVIDVVELDADCSTVVEVVEFDTGPVGVLL